MPPRLHALLFARVLAVAMGATVVACGGDTGPEPPDGVEPPRWDCPVGWVPYQGGGCGPAVLLCAGDGADATDGSCDAADPRVARPVVDEDGVEGVALHLRPDGTVGGAWPDPDFVPETGAGDCSVEEGWHPVGDGTCEPVLRDDCPDGTGPVGERCTATGPGDCPSGPWPELPPEAAGARAVHLLAGSDPARADGSMATPFAALGPAIAAAGADGWVVVAEGDYAAGLELTSAAHLLGACAERVRLVAPAGVPALLVRGGALDLRGVTLGGGGPGLRVEEGGSAVALGVRVQEATGHAVYVEGAGSSVELRELYVRDMQADATGAKGRGLEARAGARLTVAGAVIDRSLELGLLVDGAGTVAEATDVVIRGTRSSSSGTFGRAVSVQDAAELTGRRLVLLDNREAGIVVVGPGANATVEDLVVRGTRSKPGGGLGDGLAAQAGGHLVVSRFLLDDNREAGVSCRGSGADVELTAGVIRGTRPRPDGVGGPGIVVEEGCRVSATGVDLGDNQAAAAFATDEGSALILTRVRLRGTRRAEVDPPVARGLHVQGSASAVLREARVEGNHEYGVFALGLRSSIEVTDSVVLGAPSMGMQVVLGATARVRRSTFVDCVGLGLLTAGGALLDVRDTAVLGTTTNAGGNFGRALEVGSEGTVIGRRLLIEGSVEGGVVAVPSDGSTAADIRLELEDVVVRDVEPSMRGFGVGVSAWATAVTLHRVAVVGTHGAALLGGLDADLAVGSRVEAEDLFVRDVSTSTIRFAPGPFTFEPTGSAVAYGLHVGSESELRVTRVVVDQGGWGFFRTGGAFVLQDALIRRQLDGAGASSAEPAPPLELVRVVAVDNAIDEFVEDASLPEAAVLPRPTGVDPG